jgi:hypothetical protein
MLVWMNRAIRSKSSSLVMPKPDEAGTVGIDEVLLDLHVRAVPHRPLDHRVGLEAEQLISWLCTAIDPATSTGQRGGLSPAMVTVTSRPTAAVEAREPAAVKACRQ